MSIVGVVQKYRKHRHSPEHGGKLPAGYAQSGTAQNGGFNSTSDARTAKTGAEYLAEAVTGRNAAPEQAQQNIDNNSDMGYNNINNMRGDINAQRGDRLHSAAGNRVRADSGPVDTEPQRTDRNDGRGNLQVSGIVLLSDHAKSTLKGRGVVVEEAYDASGNKAAFCSALDAARNSDAKNGWAVTPKTVESLDENCAKPFMTENGTAGYALF